MTPDEFVSALSADTSLDVAVGLARLGVGVFPTGADKVPATRHGFKDATTNLRTVRRWFGRSDDLCVGVVPSECGLAVIDLDVVDGGLDLAATQVELHTGVVAYDHPHALVTPSGGRHLWFSVGSGPGPSVSNSRWPAVDVRGEGGYVIVWAPNGGYSTDQWERFSGEDWRDWPVEEWGSRGVYETPLGDAEVDDLVDRLSVGESSPGAVRFVLSALEGARPGERHAAGLRTLGRLFSSTRINVREVLSEARRMWLSLPGPDGGRVGEWEAMVRWVAGQERGRGLASSEGSVVVWEATPEGVRAAVRGLGFEVRYNVRRQRTEVRIPDGLRVAGQGDWEPESEQIDALLVHTVAEVCGVVTSGRRWREWLQWCLVGEAPVDPFVEWLQALPAWDGTPRLDVWLYVFEPDPATSTEVLQFVSRLIPMACVARALTPGCGADIMPVLVGPQGIGKSRGLRALMAEPDWFSDSLSLHDEHKVWVEKSLGPVLIEVAEMAGASRSETAKLKSLLSATKDEVRLAYRRDAGEYPRRFFPVGTANDRRTLPNDPTGNRRFAVINFVGNSTEFPTADDVVETVVANREMLFAEALVRVAAGEGLFPDSATVGMLSDAAEGARIDDTEIEDMVGAFLEGCGSKFHVGGLIREVGAWVAPLSGEQLPPRGLVARVIRALEHAGCVRDSRKSRGMMAGDKGSVVRFWWTPPATQNEDTSGFNRRGLGSAYRG